MAESDKLTRKEELFCREYTRDYNGAAAARRAGYEEKSAAKAAHRLLSKPQVLQFVRELQKEQAERLCLSSDLVVIETLDLLAKCKAAVPVMEWNYSDHCMRETGFYQVDSKGATKCLELLAKFQGMDGKKVQDEEDGPVFYKDDIPDPEGENDG